MEITLTSVAQNLFDVCSGGTTGINRRYPSPALNTESGTQNRTSPEYGPDEQRPTAEKRLVRHISGAAQEGAIKFSFTNARDRRIEESRSFDLAKN